MTPRWLAALLPLALLVIVCCLVIAWAVARG
jgi:hypothetical protein